MEIELKVAPEIKPFISFPSLVLQKIPQELENEPYSNTDSDYRPEIRYRTNLFKYEIEEYTSKCYIDSVTVYKKIKPSAIVPEKNISYLSLLDIYNNYGLNITYSFMYYLYYNPLSIKNPVYLVCYLEGSMVALNLDRRCLKRCFGIINSDKEVNIGDQILYASEKILSKLIEMDAKYPKLIDNQQSTIINQQIPMEILSYIIRSIRVCKSMSAMVLYDRYKINPTIDELEFVQWYYNKSDCVHYTYNEVTKENIYICNTLRDGGYMLINKEGHFKMKYLETGYFISRKFISADYSLSDYMEVYLRFSPKRA
jgi:hypothetical protein